MLGHTWRTGDRSAANPRDVADSGPERSVRAQVLFQLLTGWGPLHDVDLVPPGETAPRAVRAEGLRISEHLNCRGARLRCPLELKGCYFDHHDAPVMFDEATASAIGLETLPTSRAALAATD